MTVERFENFIGGLLRVGVIVSLLVIVVGTVISFVHHPGYLWSPKDLAPLTTPGSAVPQSMAAVWAGVWGGHGQALVMAGLLLLIATPVMRVAVSAAAFGRQRDWIYVAITMVVLGLLIASFFLGSAGV